MHKKWNRFYCRKEGDSLKKPCLCRKGEGRAFFERMPKFPENHQDVGYYVVGRKRKIAGSTRGNK